MRIVLTVKAGPHQGRVYAFQEHDTFIVGRGSWAHFQLPEKDRYFSRTHFMLEVNPPCCRLVDSGSTNGTYVNGRRVTVADLADGDEIRGGQTVLGVSIERHSDVFEGPTIVPGQPAAAAPDPRERATNGLPATAGPSTTAPWAPQPGAPGPAASVEAGFLPPDYRDRIRRSPQPIAGYQLIDELGRGGMGIVYRAVREADGSLVALKTVVPAAARTEADVERLLREARILQQLDHPHIVGFRDVGRSQGQLFFAMQYVHGPDAARLLRELGGPLAIGLAVRLVCQLLEALVYAHGKGFVHRDIKPSNLLISREDGREMARLGDFGLARTYQASRLSGLTMTGDVAGTAPYMAPEQITRYREALPSVDQYATAATLYNLLTREFVYDFPRDVGRQVAMILQQDPLPLQSRRGDLPSALATAIHRALARDPQARFADAAAFRQALLPFADRD